MQRHILLLTLIVPALVGAAPPGPQARKGREFHFTYEATVTGLEAGSAARVWLPLPPNREEQEVTIVRQDLPAAGKIGKDAPSGNEMLYVEARASAEGKVALAVTFRIKRFEAAADHSNSVHDIVRFLRPDSLVPVGGRCLELLKDTKLPEDPLAAARVLYDVTSDHMRYSKEGGGWGRGDAVWACASGYGNCSDFHSLFIAMARARKIPAKFEIGFALPERRGKGEVAGYHCWAKFNPAGRGWVPVDISAGKLDPAKKDYYFGNLTEDRVLFSVGRDLRLVPPQQGPPLNFFIYPYVEVDGMPYPDAKVQRRFRYEDVQR